MLLLCSTMKRIISILSKFIPKDLPRPIGRWKIEYCNHKINNKIDLSNEDHCGPCGQYAITKINESKAITTTTPNKHPLKNTGTFKPQ